MLTISYNTYIQSTIKNGQPSYYTVAQSYTRLENTIGLKKFDIKNGV